MEGTDAPCNLGFSSEYTSVSLQNTRDIVPGLVEVRDVC